MSITESDEQFGKKVMKELRELRRKTKNLENENQGLREIVERLNKENEELRNLLAISDNYHGD